MPNSNNALETALRNIKNIIREVTGEGMSNQVMIGIRAELINFKNLEVKAAKEHTMAPS